DLLQNGRDGSSDSRTRLSCGSQKPESRNQKCSAGSLSAFCFLVSGFIIMIILGINAHHADASACIVVDGKLVAAAEVERFRRVKHWAGFPSAAVDYCLREAGVALNDVDHIAVNRDPNARLLQRMKFILARRPSVEAIRRRLANRAKIRDLRTEIVETFRLDSLKPKLHNV